MRYELWFSPVKGSYVKLEEYASPVAAVADAMSRKPGRYSVHDGVGNCLCRIRVGRAAAEAIEQARAVRPRLLLRNHA
jgi:hypothetical protein